MSTSEKLILGPAPEKARRGYSIYTRRCKRCEKLYRTPYRNGHFCPGCMDERSPMKGVIMSLYGLKEQFDKEIDEDISEIKKIVRKKVIER